MYAEETFIEVEVFPTTFVSTTSALSSPVNANLTERTGLKMPPLDNLFYSLSINFPLSLQKRRHRWMSHQRLYVGRDWDWDWGWKSLGEAMLRVPSVLINFISI